MSLGCRKFNHPWMETEAADRPAHIFPRTSLPVVTLACPSCGTERYDEYKLLVRVQVLIPSAVQPAVALGKELSEARRDGETRGQATTRFFLMERGLIKTPAKFSAARRERESS